MKLFTGKTQKTLAGAHGLITKLYQIFQKYLKQFS